MKHAYRAFFVVVLLLLRLTGHGQQAEQTVSGNFNHLDFEQFVRQVEAQTAYRFFFDPAAVDSLFVTLQVQQQPVRVVLEQALQNTPFRFAIDDENRVFVTSSGAAINPALPGEFYQPKPDGPVAATQVEEPAAGPVARSRYVSASEFKVYELGMPGPGDGKGRVTLAGHIREQKSGEPVIGASIYSEAPNVGASTDQFGYYSLTLPAGRYDLKIRGVGIKNTKRQVQLRGNAKLEIEVEEDIITLKEVVIEAEKDRNVSGMQMGLEKLDIKTMRQVPTAFGETDILRVIMTLPGVKTVGEGSTGLNVRGGATDQNLILFNDATIYNPSHLFGFFSAFNPDMLKTVELYKSAMPARYGGRLSSVLDIATRDGNKKKFSG
ncbi:MAG TPA: TonB-dependent receptor, partial [Hymenobacter sp.]